MAAPDTEQQLLTELTVLQAAEQDQRDQVGLHYLTQLAKRMVTQREPVRVILTGKLRLALSQYREKLNQVQPAAQVPASVMNPLAELNRYIDSSTPAGDEVAWTAGEPDRSEMRSVRQFKQAWSRIKAEEQVERAILLGPKNPGPINSHMLVLRTLALMRHLSPAYLQRFLAQADALLCLDRVTAKPSVTVSKARSRGRMKR